MHPDGMVEVVKNMLPFFRKIKMNSEMVVRTHRLKQACLQAVVGRSPGYAKSLSCVLTLHLIIP
jgi:hypothetical protein